MSQDILLNLIDPDPNQPRKHFDETKLQELAQSMGAKGLAVPILVRPDGDRFIIVHGERRWRAAQALDWGTIRAEVRDVSPEEASWLSLIENVQRADLSPIEEARAYRGRLAEGITQALLGEHIGKSQSYIAQKLRLLGLPDEVQSTIDAGGITEGHARQLLRLKSEQQQSALCQRATSESWTVARTRLEVDELLKQDEDDMPETPVEFVRWVFRKKGSIPGHDPYPEERLPESYSPPIAVRHIPIEEIRELEARHDYRLSRDPGYAEWLSKIFDTLPPIAVYQIDGRYILADGKYRLMAARLLGLNELNCRIYAGTELFEAEAYGAAANSAQGIPLTEEDLKYSLRKIHKLSSKPKLRPSDAHNVKTFLASMAASLKEVESIEECMAIRDIAQHIGQEVTERKIRIECEAGNLLADLEKSVERLRPTFLDVGQALAGVRDILPGDQFNAWLAEHAQMDRTLAERFMALADGGDPSMDEVVDLDLAWYYHRERQRAT